MILSDEKIKQLILRPERESDILEAINLQNEMKVHVTGEGYADALKRTMGTVRAVQYGESRELTKPVTLFLTKKIKDELSRWKNTQGTRKNYDFGEKKEEISLFRDVLSNVWKNSSIEDFAYWLNDALYTDFNGFAIVEMPQKSSEGIIRDGIPQGDEKPYIIFKAIEDIHDFKCNGRKVEYLIVRYGIKTVKVEGVDIQKTLYRVIDDKADYIYMMMDNKPVVDPDYPIITNTLGYVPAIQIGNTLNSTLNDYVKTSHINQVLPLLNDYMTRHAEHVSSEVQHAYPILAIKGTKCTYISPSGSECSKGKIIENGESVNCPHCNGTGAVVIRNSSEVVIVPEIDKQGKAYDPGMVGQYITPPTQILEHQSTELSDLENTIIYSGTGITKALAKSSIQTATEIVINLKPLEDKISSILDNIECVEKFLTDAIGEMIYKSDYKGCEVHYGRKLNIRDENLILNEIEQSKRSGMPISYIRTLLQELIATRNRNSRADMERGFMLLDLEPMAAYSLKEVLESEYASDEVKCFKMNFDDYIDRFETEYGAITLFEASRDYQTRIKDIRTILDRYNQEQLPKIEENDPSEENRNPGQQNGVTGDEVFRVDVESDSET